MNKELSTRPRRRDSTQADGQPDGRGWNRESSYGECNNGGERERRVSDRKYRANLRRQSFVIRMPKPDLRKIGKRRARTRKRIRPFAFVARFRGLFLAKRTDRLQSRVLRMRESKRRAYLGLEPTQVPIALFLAFEDGTPNVACVRIDGIVAYDHALVWATRPSHGEEVEA